MTADWATSKDKARCNLCGKWCYRVSVDCVDPDRAPYHLTTQMFYCKECNMRWHAYRGEYELGKLHAINHATTSKERVLENIYGRNFRAAERATYMAMVREQLAKDIAET